MKKQADDALPTTQFLVLALLGEGESHGYGLEQMVFTRGFRYWTDLQRSSIYSALKRLEKDGLVRSRLAEGGGGPVRKVFCLTAAGKRRLTADTLRHLTLPAHPRSEIDQGLYALPFLPAGAALEAVRQGREHLEQRAAFLTERLRWCKARDLAMVALNFERPLLALRAELRWLRKVERALEDGELEPTCQWDQYEYLEPPGSDTA